MGNVTDIFAALKITGVVVLRARYWRALGGGLLNAPLLVLIAIVLASPLLMVYGAQFAGMGLAAGFLGIGLPGLAGVACTVMMVPLLMRCWCPPVARAVAEAMRLELPERPLPSAWRFIGAWLLLVLVGLVSMVAAFFLPRPWSWLMLLPVLLMLGSYQMRCSLCLHASPNTIQAALAGTTLRRTLLWLPLTCVLSLLIQWGLSTVQGWFVSPYVFEVSLMAIEMSAVLALLSNLALLAVVLALWAALSLQSLGARPAPAPSASPAPAPVRCVSTGRAWLLTLLAVLVVGAGAACANRFTLLHYYLVVNDRDYETDINRWTENLASGDLMQMAFQKSACAGRRGRLETLFAFRLKPEKATLDAALACAAGNQALNTAELLIEKGADVNGRLPDPGKTALAPLTPLQYAAFNGHADVAALLLRGGADPSLQVETASGTRSPGPLHFAAIARDVSMMATLVKAGAKTDVALPRAPVFLFMEASMPRDGAAGNWETVLAAAERAGLAIGAADADGSNLLHWAASQGDFDLIDLLLARGVDRLHKENGGALPFMRLAAWYQYSSTEPGPALEAALTALARDVADINAPVSFYQRHAGNVSSTENAWTIARVAAIKPRLRAVFGERIDYSMLGGPAAPAQQAWPLSDREPAAKLVAALSAGQLAAAPSLATALREKGWNDLALLAERKR